MTSTLFKRTYSMVESRFQRMARREKSLQARPIAWLRAKAKVDLHYSDRELKGLKKTQIVYLLMERQFSSHSMEIYTNIAIERSAPRRP